MRFAATLLVALGLLAGACGMAPVTATSAPARTAMPTWTLPFSVETYTPAPATQPPASASATPMAASPSATAPVEPTAPPTEAPPTPVPPSPTPDSPPRLVIPYLKLDREIERVGIVDGTWDLTNLGDEVGWLTTTGQRPGDDLAVVLVGHITTAPGKYGPFAGIGQLTSEDQIIYRWGGQDYVYSLRRGELAGENEVQELYVPDGSQLLLVTCSNWDFLSSLYTRRLILTAEWIGTVASQ